MMSAIITATIAATASAQATMLANMTQDELIEWHRLNDFVGPQKPETFLERNGLLLFVLLECSIFALAFTGMAGMILWMLLCMK